MGLDFKVFLSGRGGEAIEYRDENGVYRFGLLFRDKTWVVQLPGTKGPFFEAQEFSEEQRRKVFERIRKFLQNKKDFVVFGLTHPVVFESEGPISAEIAERRRRTTNYFRQQGKSDRED